MRTGSNNRDRDLYERRNNGDSKIAPPLYEDQNLAIEKWLEVDKRKPPVAYNPHQKKKKKKFKKLSKQEVKALSKGERKKYKREKKRRFRPIKIFLKTILVLVILALIAAGFLFSYVWSMLGNVNTIDLGDDLGIDPVVAEELADYKNILIAGVDARAGEDMNMTRTDAIMILSLNTKTKTYSLISVYRDTLLEMENTEGEYYLDKINAANTEGGIVNTVKALNRNMDLNIDEVVLLNWKTVADLVDGLGGIEVEIKDYEIDEMNKYILDTAGNIGGSTEQIGEPGVYNLNGVQAVTYARIRKVGNADFERTERMRTLVDKTFDKVFDVDLMTLDSVAEKASSEVATSLDKEGILRLAYDLTEYTSSENTGWPYLEIEDGSYLTSTGTVNGASTVIPRTLEENVERLHELMFGQEGYVPTSVVEEINQKIINKTGLY